MAKSASVGRGTLEEALRRVAERLAQIKTLKQGDIVFRLAGPGGGTFVVECSEKGARVMESAAAGADHVPLVEVIGDARRIQAILAGTKNAREQFLAGGFRIRGDLRYLSNIAMEVGIIKDPL